MGFKMKRSNMAGGIMIDKKPDGHMPDFRAKSAPLQMNDDKDKKKAKDTKKTLAKQSPDLKKAVKKSNKNKVSKEEYYSSEYQKKVVPYSGGFTQKELDAMTEEQKAGNIDGYEPKSTTTKKKKKKKTNTTTAKK
jgi:hypothetical protein